MTCSIDGCERRATRRGWCGLHYARWRATGDPLATKIAAHADRLALLDRLIATETDDCVDWPACGTNGYGAIMIKGRTVPTHAYACEHRYGPRPAGMEAAHRCGRRSCVNPRHLRWATHLENELDKELHGTRLRGDLHPFTKLSGFQAWEAACLIEEGATWHEVADRFNVKLETIRRRVVPLIARGAA